jgi:hypothetical protein
MEGVFASMAALNALFLEEEALAAASAGADGGAGVDLLDRLYRIRLERLGLEKRLEAQVAALTARDAAQSLDLQQAMTPPDASTHDRTYAEISTVEEIAGILTISSGAAGAFIAQARRVCSLPSVYEALSCGALSWQGARIIADETENLDHPAAVALADHFLDPDAPNTARGRPAGQLVPSRLRSKVRAWRERRHPESIEKRHAKGVADRRVEFTPDRDGMAWIAAYLPADTATGIWNRARAIARGLQGPNETRTLPSSQPISSPTASSPPPKPSPPTPAPARFPTASRAWPPPQEVGTRKAPADNAAANPAPTTLQPEAAAATPTPAMRFNTLPGTRYLMNSSGSPPSSDPTNQ